MSRIRSFFKPSGSIKRFEVKENMLRIAALSPRSFTF